MQSRAIFFKKQVSEEEITIKKRWERWERWGTKWIRDRFVSSRYNIFIVEVMDTGLSLYWFDDGPEIPTESVEIGADKIVEFEVCIRELRLRGDQVVCDYLAGFFPDLQKYWLENYGGI
jgi:hypothetical protein